MNELVTVTLEGQRILLGYGGYCNGISIGSFSSEVESIWREFFEQFDADGLAWESMH